MKLRNKLLFLVANLFFLLIIIFSFFFYYIFKFQLKSANDKLISLFNVQKHQKEERELCFFKERLYNEKKKLDSLFLILKPQKETWSFLATTLATNPDLGFAQLRKMDSQEVFSLLPAKACFYSLSTIAMNDRFFFVALERNQENYENNLFLAYPLSSAVYGGYPTYLLFSLKEVEKEAKEFVDILTKKSPLSFPQPLSFDESDEVKLGLIKILSNFFEKGVDIFPQKEAMIPQGIAMLTSDGKGKALLSSELFLKRSFFNDTTFYEKNRPASAFFPVAEGEFLITDISHEIYFVNSALYEGSLFSLGFPLSPLLKNFAQATHQNAILVNDNKILGYSPHGFSLDKKFQDEAMEQNPPHLSLLPTKDLNLYLVHEDETIKDEIIDFLNSSFFKNFFWQVEGTLFCLLVLALIVFYYVTKYLTSSLSRLASPINEGEKDQFHEIPQQKTIMGKDEITQVIKTFNEMALALKEKDRIRSLLNKVVSKEIAEEILKTDIHLGGEDRVITILFADIRNFTELSQKLPPQKTVAILNTVMTMISRIIESEGGVIDKYVGDEVMALFGAPVAHPDHALRALSSAKLIVETLRKWNKERISQGEIPIEIGIGINSGLVVAGNMGAEDRLNYTVVGPSVNLASRLCKAALPMQIIISEFTLEEPSIKESFYVEKLTPVTLKGYAEVINVFQVTGFKWET